MQEIATSNVSMTQLNIIMVLMILGHGVWSYLFIEQRIAKAERLRSQGERIPYRLRSLLDRNLTELRAVDICRTVSLLVALLVLFPAISSFGLSHGYRVLLMVSSAIGLYLFFCKLALAALRKLELL